MAIYTWASYVGATGCTKYGPAGCQAVVTYLEDWFPEQRSLGICNCREVFDGGSWSHHAECRAYDEGYPASTGIGVKTLALLGPHGARLGIDHMIVNHNPGASGRGDPRIYSARSPQGRVYTGAHPHKDHNHIGLTRAAGRNLTYATLVAVCGAPPKQGGNEVMLPLKDGDGLDRGRPEKLEDVRLLQDLLGFTGGDLDGRYGAGTAAKVKPFSGGDGTVVNGTTYKKILVAALGGSGEKGEKGDKGDDGADGADGKDGKDVTLTIKTDTVL